MIKKTIMDGWSNLLTSIGISGRDKRTGATVDWEPITEMDAEALYSGDDIAAKVVDDLPDDMVREWIELKNADPEVLEKLRDRMTALDVKTKLNQALKWSRLYGGSAILLVTDDNGADLSVPLDSPKKIVALQVLSRYELHFDEIDKDVRSPNFGYPKTYRVTGSDAVGVQSQIYNQKIHYSRIIRFDGVALPRRLFVHNEYWGDSVLTRLFNPLRNYQISHDGAVTSLQDYSVGVIKIKNLAELIAAGHEDKIKTRVELMNLSKSVIRSIVIDDTESFDNVTRALTGVPEILTKVGERLVASTNMPHTKLFGTSPSGLGGSGRHESQNWYDSVSNEQETVIRPRLDKLLRLIEGEADMKISQPVDFDFKPLWQLDDKEQADVRKVQADTDAVYISNGVLDPEEIAQSRFGSGKWSGETLIDTETRERVGGEIEDDSE